MLLKNKRIDVNINQMVRMQLKNKNNRQRKMFVLLVFHHLTRQNIFAFKSWIYEAINRNTLQKASFFNNIFFILTIFFVAISSSTFSQTITLSSENPAIPAAYIQQGTTTQPLYKAVIEINGGTTLKKLSFTANGSYIQSDIDRTYNNFGLRVWMNTSDNLAIAQAISNLSDIEISGSETSINLYNPYLSDNTYYIWITADIHPNAVTGHNLTVAALTPSNFTFQKGTINGTLYAGGTQTIIADGSNIYLNKNSLSGFSYIIGNGPSPPQSYTVDGTGLTNNVTITAPAHYEISTTSGAGFTNSITLSPSGGFLSTTNIYVRLKSGLNINSYNSENITHTSTGATTKTITCNGEVTCNTLPPVVSTPINYCLNETATQLNATGQNLSWITQGTSTVGPSTLDDTKKYSDNTQSNNNITFFTVDNSVSSVKIYSVKWAIGKNQSVTNVQVAIQHSNGTPVTNGVQSSPAITGSAGPDPVEHIATFTNLELTPGDYRVALETGSGNFCSIKNPTYPQSENSGSISITGNNSNQLYTDLHFSYRKESTTAPTPSTSSIGTTYYYVTQTINGCTSGPAVIEVVVSDETPDNPGTITGPTTQCPGFTGQTYSIAPVLYADTYNWSVPTGWAITNGQGTNEIIVTTGGIDDDGNISVIAINGCGTSTASTLMVNLNDIESPTITFCPGNQTTNANNTGCTYLVPNNNWDATATDNCVTPTITHNYNGGGTSLIGEAFPVGTTTVTWTASDGGGLESTCDFDITVVNPVSATVQQYTPDNECPQLDPILGFEPNNDGPYNAGYSEILFQVQNNDPTTDWSFDFNITDANVTDGFVVDSVNAAGNSSYNQDILSSSGTFSNIPASDDLITITARVKNIPGEQIEVDFNLSNISDANGCSTDYTENRDTVIMNVMPVVGQFE